MRSYRALVQPEYLDLTIGGHTFRGRALHDRSPNALHTLRTALPLDARLSMDQWSGYVVRIIPRQPVRPTTPDPVVAYPYPGLVMLDPSNGDLAICFGQGRLSNGLGPLPAVPLFEIGGDIEGFRPLGVRLQYDGAKEMRISLSADQASPLVAPRRERGRRVAIELGEAFAVADLLEESAPVTAGSLASKLPLVGIGTSTFLSGPLVRYRDQDGSETELALETLPNEASHTVLFPGYVYYRTEEPRGLRIATSDATTMGGPVPTKLVPVARLGGEWSAFREQAALLRETGMQPLRLRLLED